MKSSGIPLTLLFLLTLAGQSWSQEVKEEVRGGAGNTKPVHVYTLTNKQGLRARVMDYGATLLSMETPDRNGKLENITLHLAAPEDYLGPHPLFGSVVGRYANRIDTGGFTIDGVRHELKTVNAQTKVHIHGGATGFQRQYWKPEVIKLPDAAAVKFSLISEDGHEGFPGQVEASVTYFLTNANELRLDYTAVTTKPTHVNLTNHAYWNLGGAASGPVLPHKLQIHAAQRLAMDARKVPTGVKLPVADTPYDFRHPRPIGEKIAQAPGGYDDCYVIDREGAGEVVRAARLEDPKSGRVMQVWTTAPGVQVYTANGLNGKLSANGVAYGPQHAVCLECQHFPDSPNKPEFPATLLRPGQLYKQTTVHSFSVAKEWQSGIHPESSLRESVFIGVNRRASVKARKGSRGLEFWRGLLPKDHKRKGTGTSLDPKLSLGTRLSTPNGRSPLVSPCLRHSSMVLGRSTH